jgi:hypothetical protein
MRQAKKTLPNRRVFLYDSIESSPTYCQEVEFLNIGSAGSQ